MNSVINFGAGPAMLPASILQEVQQELLDWKGLGISILEVGHRTPHYQQLMHQTEQAFRTELSIPDDYHVLFLGGAARTQFSMIPLNFLTQTQKAAYLITGIWSSIAFTEACKVKHAYCVASGEASHFTKVPTREQWQIHPETPYFFYTPNETVNGVRIASVPDVGSIPIMADMTSCLLSEPIDVSRFELIFAGAQKNIANAGLCIVIIKNRLLDSIQDACIPSMLDYRVHVSNQSLYATPPTFNCYIAAKMLDWVKQQGGVKRLYELNCKKASMLYDYIDNSQHYLCKVEPSVRSLVNVCFHLREVKYENAFINESEKAGLIALRGHRVAGGLRASLYNAMPMEGVSRLIQFMDDFAREHCL